MLHLTVKSLFSASLFRLLYIPFLSFFLTYFFFSPVAIFLIKQQSEQWMGGDDEPLSGFTWRGGCERETTGIQIWNEVFVVEKPDGSKVSTDDSTDFYRSFGPE